MTSGVADSYKTITAPVRAPELKVKGSRFIADIVPATSKEEIEAFLRGLRKEFYDASHHCYAYRLGPQGLLIRAADDGEPSGTAGKPILLMLTNAALTDTFLVVTRYFGGTLLGTGGLARAYAESASFAISLAVSKEVFLKTELSLLLNYEDLAPAQRILAAAGGTIITSVYDEKVALTISIRRSLADELGATLINSLNGRIEIRGHEDM